MALKKFSCILNFLKFSLRSTRVRSLLNSLKIGPNVILVRCGCFCSLFDFNQFEFSEGNIVWLWLWLLPAEDSEHEVEHEEGADDDQRNKVDPVEEAAQGIIGLKQSYISKVSWYTVGIHLYMRQCQVEVQVLTFLKTKVLVFF